MRFAIRLTRLRPGALFTIACLASAAIGALVASAAMAARARTGETAWSLRAGAVFFALS
ncbi:MAG: hypothetical protein ACLQU5_11670 [Isosphaeraceae bacterium]|jgi:hypothetical protein